MSNLLLCWRSSYTSLSSLNTARSTFIAELPLQVHSLLYISLVTLLSHHTHTPSLPPTTTHHPPPTTHLWTKIIPLQLFIIDPKMVMPQKCRLGNSTIIILRINGVLIVSSDLSDWIEIITNAFLVPWGILATWISNKLSIRLVSTHKTGLFPRSSAAAIVGGNEESMWLTSFN